MNSSRPAAPGTESARAWVLAFAEGWLAPASADAFADHFQPWFDPHIRLIQPQLPTLVGHQAFRERFARPLFALIPRPERADGTLRNRYRLRLHRADTTRHPRRAPHRLAGLRPGHPARGVGGRAGELLRSDAAAAGHPHPPPGLAGAGPGRVAIPTSPNRTILGAVHIVDISKQRFEEVMESVDLVIDLVGGNIPRRSCPLLRPGRALSRVVGRADLARPPDGVLGLRRRARPAPAGRDRPPDRQSRAVPGAGADSRPRGRRPRVRGESCGRRRRQGRLEGQRRPFLVQPAGPVAR
jgi:hypothetical protein